MGHKPLWKFAAGIAAFMVAAAGAGCSGQGNTNIPAPSGGGGIFGINPDLPQHPNTQEAKVTYAGYNVPATTATREGQIWNNFRFNVQKPCTNCWITGIQASLKSPDGRVLNHDTGHMLHHMVLAANGSGKTDPTCGSFFGTGQRFFASGNERTRFSFPTGFGFDVGAADSWTLIADLMNMNSTRSTVNIEMTYKFVPKNRAQPAIKAITPIWLDVAQCLTSEVPARTGAYSYVYNWNVNVPGKLLGIGGHLHDGGTFMNISFGDGRLICNSVAGYGGPGYESPMDHGDHGGGGGDDHSMGGMQHLSSMSQCTSRNESEPVATLQRGNVVRMTAYYDTNKYTPHGTHPVMGIAVGFIVP